MHFICLLNFSTFIARNLVFVTLKIFIDLVAYFGSTVSNI